MLYPVAETAEAALAAPRGFAARERAAEDLARGPVRFVTETVGPAFASREAALDAYAGRLDDDRPGRKLQVSPEARWCVLRPVAAEARRPRRPPEPVNKDGRRWPAPDPKAAPPVWRLSISYWRLGADQPAPALPQAAARTLRRRGGKGLDKAALSALSRQPMKAVKPQQPLDIGLFETRPPEAPHIVMPDE